MIQALFCDDAAFRFIPRPTHPGQSATSAGIGFICQRRSVSTRRNPSRLPQMPPWRVRKSARLARHRVRKENLRFVESRWLQAHPARRRPAQQVSRRFMKKAVTAIVLLIVLVHSGCTSTVTREALMHKATRNSLTPQPDITYYCGSEGGFDIFYLQPVGATTFRRAQRLRVPESENAVSDRFGYTTEQSRWRVLVGADRRAPELGPKPPPPTPSAVTPSANAGATPAPNALDR